MIIKESEPWLLWTDKVSFGLDKGEISKTFEGETDFTISMHLKILSKSSDKKTIFAKLPNYVGIDIEHESNRLLLILNINKSNETKYEYIMSDIGLYDDFNYLTFSYKKEEKLLEVFINQEVAIKYKLENDEELSVGHEPHIIFGAGNFPHNNFNLNYCSYDVDFLIIAKKMLYYSDIVSYYNKEREPVKEIIGLYDFDKKTEYKIFDYTNNCNFIHKILE